MMSTQRVMVIGLDGATFDLMRPWLAEGKLPTIARLMREGAAGEMTSVPNMNSGAAWATFATGLNPGKHGVYWLVEYKPNSYELQPTNALSRHGETIWARLSRRGKRVAVLNVPITWPAEPVNGVLVAGWDCPGVRSRGFTYPPEFAQELLRACDGEFIITAAYEAPEATLKGDLALGIRTIHKQTESHLKAARYVLSQGPWDLFIVIFTATDIAHHLLWKTFDPNHPAYDPQEAARYGGAIYDIYRQLDDAIAELIQYADEDTTVIVMSDHGAGMKAGAVHSLNRWLESQGLLKRTEARPSSLRRQTMRLLADAIWASRRVLNEAQRERIKGWLPMLRGLRSKAEMHLYSAQIDWSRTLAYGNDADDFIRINLKGREPQGIVAPEDYEALRDHIIERLYAWRDPQSGRPLVEKVWKREEIYFGPFVDKADDILIRWADFVPQGLDDGRLERPRQFFDQISGGHKPNGILIMRGPGIVPGTVIEGAELLDMPPTILHLLGEPVPTIMDGKVLTQAFSPDALAAHPPVVGEGEWMASVFRPPSSVSSGEGYSEEEAHLVEERLRGLGYLA
jgi:predicted AlkP superfamily phosphohydrolase/phosphomutase